jgi:hypothetical protein
MDNLFPKVTKRIFEHALLMAVLANCCNWNSKDVVYGHARGFAPFSKFADNGKASESCLEILKYWASLLAIFCNISSAIEVHYLSELNRNKAGPGLALDECF